MESDSKSGRVIVRLHDGDLVELAIDEAEQVVDELWLLASRMKGAVTAAAKLKFASMWTFLHGEDMLTEPESAAVREALGQVTASREAQRPNAANSRSSNG
jgi:hypothetical protein